MAEPVLTDAMTQLHTTLVEATDVEAVLLAVARATTATLPASCEASVTLRRGGQPRTVAASGPRALRCDEAEYAAGDGPCLDAADDGVTVLVEDLSAETRWPAWTAATRREGFASAAAFPVGLAGDADMALNVYCDEPLAWAEHVVAEAERHAQELSRVLRYSLRLVDLATTTADLRAALESRAVIDQAIGIVMAQNRCSAQQAAELLRQASQHRNVRMRDLAAQLVREVGGSDEAAAFVPRTEVS
ncbi:GAF and ANTAR domain-containing protein [Cellulomonas massiliensis]|uniref:GAF and ANTAR domain-containing protein n=1 Tax=Cellulomonas massiliensis TaxID=1465811 RepID=UPI0002DED2F1|nr:GAF and ANTAR domain-containing protein [Cellulomonas massiliensis]